MTYRRLFLWTLLGFTILLALLHQYSFEGYRSAWFTPRWASTGLSCTLADGSLTFSASLGPIPTKRTFSWMFYEQGRKSFVYEPRHPWGRVGKKEYGASLPAIVFIEAPIWLLWVLVVVPGGLLAVWLDRRRARSVAPISVSSAVPIGD